MKRRIYMLFAAAAFAMSGCGAWLDEPRPMGENDERDAFNTEQGFRSVLTGAYIGMSRNELYGRNMTMVYPEMFAQNWTSGANSSEDAARRFDFAGNSDLRNAIASAWLNYYGRIVNLNSLLNAVDDKRHLFTEANYKMVKGEALGLRAFLHFEVLRLWGPVPKGANPDTPAIPYVTEVTKDINQLVSIPYGEVLEAIIRDLNMAEDLLVDDPITKHSRDVLNAPSNDATVSLGDEFYYFRQNRFNLYAVKATKARYYLWTGNKPEALRSAGEVIDGVLDGGDDRVFTLCDNSYFSGEATELTLEPEHIFAIHRSDMGEMLRALYRVGTQATLRQSRTVVGRAYDNDPNDIRWSEGRYWVDITEGSNTYFIYKKYITPENRIADEVVAENIPLIRLPEMYLIATECAGSMEQAREFFSVYRQARNINPQYTADMVDEASVLARMEKEYIKEFLGEGQMFYYYKRQGATSLSWPEIMPMEQSFYVIPKPDAQISFE